MNPKLYPPAIEGKIPAFAGTSIRIPFGVNRAVSMTEVGRMKLRLKTVKTNQLLGEYDGTWSYNEVTGNYYAVFDLKSAVTKDKTKLVLNPGQYYKVQIAFVRRTYVEGDPGQVGYFSSVGVIKCTTYPIMEIPSLTDNYYGNYEYVGLYSQPDDKRHDVTEKAYSYCFELKDAEDNIIATTGTQIHNSATDTSTTESCDRWSVRKNLIEGVPYYLTYKVTTTNGLECESQSYVIVAQESVDSDLQDKCDLIATSNFEDGYIHLALRPKVKKGVVNGSFVLARSSSEDNFESWNEIYRFSYKNLHVYGNIGESDDLSTEHPETWHNKDIPLWDDFTVQQGTEYIYSLQAYNAKGLYSNRLVNREWVLNFKDKDMDANGNYKTPDGYDERRKGYYFTSIEKKITADFEDMFLFDGERQLKIRYNPKVTSFKSTILESKIDTLGGKYPFVFRNGNVEYKEFPIAGLLSLISDPNEHFLKGVQTTKLLYRSEATGEEEIGPGDTHVTMDNIRRERQFKMEALAWLTNGKPKLFRSPGEGNFIVRVMNVSMTPLDVVGRMLHNFSSTAYEIAEYNFDNLNTYGFISAPERDNRDLKVGQIHLAEPIGDFDVANNVIYTPAIYQANFTHVRPGTIIAINFADGMGSIEVEIGTTGAYYVLVKDKAISSITLLRAGNEAVFNRDSIPKISEWEDAVLTFCYYDSKPTDNFSRISKIAVQDEFRQFIGPKNNINLIDKLEDIRRQTGRFHYIRVYERQIVEIYKTYLGWSKNPYGTDIFFDYDWNPATIYHWNGLSYDANFNSSGTVSDNYFDGHPNNRMDAPSYLFELNNSGVMHMNGRKLPKVSEEELTSYSSWLPETRGRIDAINGIEKVTNLRADTGLIVEIAYRIKIMEYAVEDENPRTNTAKQNWQSYIHLWQETLSDPESTKADIQRALTYIENSYKTYIDTIEKALEEEVDN